MSTTLEMMLAGAESDPGLARMVALVVDGQRDFVTGADQITCAFVDRRVSGEVGLDFVVARVLASAWRRLEGEPAPSVRILAATYGAKTAVREIPLEEWGGFAAVGLHSDGASAATGGDSRARRFVVESGHAPIWSLFRLAETEWAYGFTHFEPEGKVPDSLPLSADNCVPGVLTLRFGFAKPGTALGHMLSLAGGAGTDQAPVVVVLAYAPTNLNPVVGSLGGVRNAWRSNQDTLRHLAGSHVSEALGEALSAPPIRDPWSDNQYRTDLFNELEALKGTKPTAREFLDALALATPLRRLLPPHLTRFFPEVETVFSCSGDPLWDQSGPAERLLLLREIAESVRARRVGFSSFEDLSNDSVSEIPASVV